MEDLRFPHRLGRLCRCAVEGAMPKKNVSLFESLIFIFQHADVLWLHFWKLAALGRILWPVLQFLLWVCQSSPDSGQSVLLGLDTYSFFVYSTGDFVTGPQGTDCITVSVYMMGLSLKVYSKYWAITLQLPSKLVLLFYFLPAFNGRFGLPLLRIKEVCVGFF